MIHKIKSLTTIYAFTFLVYFSSCGAKEISKETVSNNTASNLQDFSSNTNPFLIQSKDTVCCSVGDTVGYPKLKKWQSARDVDGFAPSLKDGKGRLWFASSGGGVYCYDGKLFRQFTTKDGLSHNNVDAIYEDTKGVIWFGTSDGITTFDGNKFTKISITTIRGANAKPYQPTTIHPLYGVVSQENLIDDIIQDCKGNFWFVADRAIYRYDGKTFTNFTVNDGVKNNTGIEFGWIERIMEDKEGKIWFGGRGSKGLFCYDGKVLTNIPLQTTTWGKDSESDFLIPQCKDKDGNIWFSNWDGIYCYNGKTFEKLKFEMNSLLGGIGDAYFDKSNYLWIGIDNRKNGYGIWKYDGKSFQYLSIKDGATPKIAGDFLEDNEGNLWIGGNDLYRFDGKKFELFSE